MELSAQEIQIHNLLIWSRHGQIAASEKGPAKATDLIEFAESAARYEYMNKCLGEPSQGLDASEIAAVCKQFAINQTIFKP